MGIFSNGIVLTQHKEPAFSGELISFVNPQTETLSLNREPIEDISDITADEIIEIAKMARIVDERDGKFLYRKLLRSKGKAVAIAVDAVDDEPYVSSQINPLLNLSSQVLGGIELCRKVAETDNAFIMAYRHLTDLETKIPKMLGEYKIIKLTGGYPAESSLSKVDAGAGRKLVVGTCALIHLYRAVVQNKRQSTVFITVAGNCISSPMNMEVSLGMSIQQVLERCGLINEPTRVVCGGSMTGIAIINTEKTLVTYTTRAVLAIRENPLDTRYNCIGCARCERACPSGLSPMYIHRFIQTRYFADLEPFDAHLCIGCGTCSYVCPSKLEVASSVLAAKEYALSHFVNSGEEEEELD